MSPILTKKTISRSSIHDSTNISGRISELLFKYKGIRNLYDWQLNCLKIPGVGQTRNLVYSLPTSGGKTLVAEILMLKQLAIKRKSVIFILPFISLVQEKIKSLSPFGLDLNFLVEEYAGSKGRYPPTKHRKCPSVYVATIEKAHTLINSFIETNNMDTIGLLVVDELHMIGDGSKRGSNLELCLLKFMKIFKNIPIVGMSATLDNLDELCQFLKAEMYISDFRPVSLTEQVKIENRIYNIKDNCDNTNINENFTFIRDLEFPEVQNIRLRDPDNVIGLVSEILPDKSCLIFCPTKKQCENLTNNILTLTDKNLLLPSSKKIARQDLLKLLEAECSYTCPLLRKGIEMGVAYHHSGLTQEERKIVEYGFLDGTISVICCTSTLAAGVNLPARRVIIRAPYIGRDFITYTMYKQMIGRAGRAGFDTEGESFVILKKIDKYKFGKLLLDSCSKCHSSLLSDGGGMIKYFVLSAISLEILVSFDEIVDFMQDSLFNIQNPNEICEILKGELQYLIDNNLIKQIRSEDTFRFVFKATDIGRAVVKGNIDVSRASDIFNELKKAETCLNLSSFLHFIYLVSPHEMVGTLEPVWETYSQRIQQLTSNDLTLFKMLGFSDSFMSKKTMGLNLNEKDYLMNRLYLTLVLYDLWNQQPIYKVAEFYNQSRGQIQSLLQSAVTFSACLSHFVSEFSNEFWGFKELLPKFTVRLSHCVSPELIPLMEIQGVKKGRAISLFKAGYDTVSKVASAEIKSLFSILNPISRKIINQMILSAKMIVREKLESLSEEVNELFFHEENNDENFQFVAQSTPKKQLDSFSFTDSQLDEFFLDDL